MKKSYHRFLKSQSSDIQNEKIEKRTPEGIFASETSYHLWGNSVSP